MELDGAESALSFITWDRSYSVGQDKLDSQHQQIIGIINELFSALRRKEGQAAVGKALNNLFDYAQSHFVYEEEVMANHDYPKFEDHKAMHVAMVRKISTLRERHQSGQDNIPMDLLQFLKDWWVNHILIQDKAYSPYISPDRNAGDPQKQMR